MSLETKYTIWESGGVAGDSYSLELDGNYVPLLREDGMDVECQDQAIASAKRIVEERKGAQAAADATFGVQWTGDL